MTNGKAFMTIGGFAKVAGVGVETIRFYLRKGLLREPPRPPLWRGRRRKDAVHQVGAAAGFHAAGGLPSVASGRRHAL
ncbi:MerR family DNA-binding transcriptional regulator [Acidihalobacter aeolianus]